MLKKIPKRTTSYFTKSLFLLGLTFILISTAWNFYQSRVLSFSRVPSLVTTSFKSENIATHHINNIIISKFNIDLPIKEARIISGVWEINSLGGSHLIGSASPGELGNIIMYGHNQKKLFGKVVGLKVGDKIQLITDDQVIHSYIVSMTKTVEPTDVSVLSPTSEETLTFYTCTGLLDTKRFVVVAKPDGMKVY